jgi:hypothetical protein
MKSIISKIAEENRKNEQSESAAIQAEIKQALA